MCWFHVLFHSNSEFVQIVQHCLELTCVTGLDCIAYGMFLNSISGVFYQININFADSCCGLKGEFVRMEALNEEKSMPQELSSR